MDYLRFTGDSGYALALIGIALGVWLFFLGIYYLLIVPIRRRRKFTQRLGGNKIGCLTRGQLFKNCRESSNSPVLNLVEKMVGWSMIENLQLNLLRADLNCNPEIFLSVAGILACMGFLIGTLKENLFLSLILAAVFWSLPYLCMRVKKRRKAALLEKQMPEALEMLARSLRAGHTLQSAIELISSEVGHPLGTEMRTVYEEQRLGLSLPIALRRMGERVASRDLHYFITAVQIQTETGGNLAEIMENISDIIRKRLTLKGKIRGLTAEGRFSAILLGLLPIIIFLILFVLNREYVMTLWQEPLGVKLMVAGAISMLLGAAWMKKMIQIRV